MMKKRRRITKTLMCGWSHADELPRPGGAGDPEILVQVKLSNRELIHSLGINCQKGYTNNKLSFSHDSHNAAGSTSHFCSKVRRRIIDSMKKKHLDSFKKEKKTPKKPRKFIYIAEICNYKRDKAMETRAVEI